MIHASTLAIPPFRSNSPTLLLLLPTVLLSLVFIHSCNATNISIPSDIDFDFDFHPGNDPNCPCLPFVHNTTQRSVQNASCLKTNIIVDKITNQQETFCYPESYGVGCASHDTDLAPFCNPLDPNQTPSFCTRSFCYVDPIKCHSSESTYTKSFFYPGLYYSYATCGETDTFRDFRIESELVGRTLKVGVPALHYPNHYRLNELEEPILWDMDINAGVGELHGIYIDFIRELAIDGNFHIEFHPVSRGSHVNPQWSPWTGCVFDVSRGLVDLCVGNFWETSFRRSLGTFSTPLMSENYFMMVPKPSVKDDLMTQLELLFEPFTPSLWGVIVGVTFFVGMIYSLLGSNIDNNNRVVDQRVRYTRLTPSNVGEHTYFAWTELVQGSDSSGTKNTAQRSVALTWSFFILIIIASYTANLAAFLGRQKVFFDIKDIDDCIRQECMICHEQTDALDNILSNIFPTLRRRAYGNITFMTDMLELDECDAILMSDYNWNLNPHLWQDCDNVFTGDPVISFIVAWPVSLLVSPSLSYWTSKAMDRKGFDRIFEMYKPPPRCMDTDDFELDDAGPKINVTSMGGPLLFLGAGILVGLFLHYRDGSTNKRKKEDAIVSVHQSPFVEERTVILPPNVMMEADLESHDHEKEDYQQEKDSPAGNFRDIQIQQMEDENFEIDFYAQNPSY